MGKLNMADEEIEATQRAITRILHKMDRADREFCDSIKAAGMNYFTEFSREYFGEYMNPVRTPDGEIMMEPSPRTDKADEWGPPRKEIPDHVVVNGVKFTKVEVQTSIRLSNVHLE